MSLEKKPVKRTLYFNGEILTLDSPLYVEAVLVEDGIIREIGERDALLSRCNSQTRFVNLNGGVLLPGFIDAHGHMTAYAQTLGVAQLDNCISFTDLANRLREFQKLRGLQKEDWIIGFGYNLDRLGRHPDKTILDRALPGFKVLISHESGGMGVVSSQALYSLGITSATPDPEGGRIGRAVGGAEPSGYLEGRAFLLASGGIPSPTDAQYMRQFELAQETYLKNGVTTIQDGFTQEDDWRLLREFSDSGRLKADVVCYVDETKSRHLAQENLSRVQRYKRHLKIGGYKIRLDGRLMDRTAWLSRPYEQSRPGETPDCGKQIYSDSAAELLVQQAMDDRMQLMAHCNGDAAADQFISLCERISGGERLDTRPILLHAHLLSSGQLSRMARLGMIASFFPTHLYFWGDTHLKNLGEDRVRGMDPAFSAAEAGVIYTFHQDTPLLLPNIVTAVWCAVNRLDRRGRVLGEEERISVLEALRAVTLHGAYQSFEEMEKGTIRPGKKADFVILDYNPLRVRAEDLRKIKVLKTIKEDELLYERKE